MRISELMPNRHARRTRRVGIRFDDRAQAMRAAVKLWHEHGLDCEIQANAIWIDAARPIAPAVMGVMERATGTPGFSEWDQP